MKRKILGISDSRPPGRSLSNSEAIHILESFDLSDEENEEPYGLEGYYIFYKKGSKFIRCYRDDYSACLKISTELQDRLSFFGLAPKVLDEITFKGIYTNVSEYLKPTTSQVNNVKLKQNIGELHHAISSILNEWEVGRSIIESTTHSMHSMLKEYSISLFDTYDIRSNIISEFYEVFKWIKQTDNYGHGDMHPGNILQDQDKYVFIDYESVFQSKGGADLDFYNLNRFDVCLNKKSSRSRKIESYLYVKSAIVNHYLEDIGKYVSLQERQKFLQKICRP